MTLPDLRRTEVTRWLHRALPATSRPLKSLAAAAAGARFDGVCTGCTLGTASVCGNRAGRVSEDRVSEDGLTDVRAYARVNEVSGTYPYRSPHLTQLSDHLASSPRFSSLARTPLLRFLYPGLSSPHRLSSYSLLFFFPPVLFFLILLLLPLIFSFSSLSFSFFSPIVFSSATRVSYSSPPSLSSPFLALHSIYR